MLQCPLQQRFPTFPPWRPGAGWHVSGRRMHVHKAPLVWTVGAHALYLHEWSFAHDQRALVLTHEAPLLWERALVLVHEAPLAWVEGAWDHVWLESTHAWSCICARAQAPSTQCPHSSGVLHVSIRGYRSWKWRFARACLPITHMTLFQTGRVPGVGDPCLIECRYVFVIDHTEIASCIC